jgi:ribosomal protein S21
MDNRNELPINGLKVAVHNNDIGRAMRKLKKKILEEGVMQELREREFYQSKGTKRRLARLASIRRYKKNQQKREE